MACAVVHRYQLRQILYMHDRMISDGVRMMNKTLFLVFLVWGMVVHAEPAANKTPAQTGPQGTSQEDSPAKGRIISHPAKVKKVSPGGQATIKKSAGKPVPPKKAAAKPAADTKALVPRVARSTLTSGIVRHEPRDSVLSLGSNERKIYYFTELRGMKGKTAIHRWQYEGKVMAEIRFKVKGERWRIWSSKNLVPGWTGAWKVSVVGEDGKVLATNDFSYTRSVDKPAAARAK